MNDFTIDQLMLFIGGVLGSLGALLLVIQKSKCKSVNCCCIKCERDVNAVIAEEKLQMRGYTGDTPEPRRSERLKQKEINLDLKEPEPEETN